MNRSFLSTVITLAVFAIIYLLLRGFETNIQPWVDAMVFVAAVITYSFIRSILLKLEATLFPERVRFRNRFSALNQQLNRVSDFKSLQSTIRGTFGGHDDIGFYFVKEQCLMVGQDQFQQRIDIKPDIISALRMGESVQHLKWKYLSSKLTPSKPLQVVDTNDQSDVFLLMSDMSISILVFFHPNLLRYLNDRETYHFVHHNLNKIIETYKRTRLFDSLERSATENEVLFEVGRQISSTLDLEIVLETILKGIKRIIDYDAAGIFIRQLDGDELEKVMTEGYDVNKLESFVNKKSQGLTAWVLEHHQPVAVPDVRLDERYYKGRDETRSQITVPLYHGDDVIGTLTLEKDDIHFYTEETIPKFMVFAEQAAVAIINAKLYRDSLRKQDLEAEMLNAGNIQRALLPKSAPEIQNLDSSVYNKPSEFVGGDLFDFFKFNGHELLMSIGDVSGKGPPASILMAVVLAGLRSQVQADREAMEYNAILNQLLCDATAPQFYATHFIAILDTKEKKIKYSNAGHFAPMIIRSNGDVQRLTKGGMVLGFLPDEIYTQDEVDLERGDLIIAFTDGLNESFDESENEFGDQRIIDIALAHQKKSASDIKNEILKAVRDFHGYDHQFDDDLTLIVMKLRS